MIEKGALWSMFRRKINSVLLMIEKGTDDWDRGHVNLALLMIKKGANDRNLTFEGVKLKDHVIFSHILRKNYMIFPFHSFKR